MLTLVWNCPISYSRACLIVIVSVLKDFVNTTCRSFSHFLVDSKIIRVYILLVRVIIHMTSELEPGLARAMANTTNFSTMLTFLSQKWGLQSFCWHRMCSRTWNCLSHIIYHQWRFFLTPFSNLCPTFGKNILLLLSKIRKY
jgi:hypothetical protein